MAHEVPALLVQSPSYCSIFVAMPGQFFRSNSGFFIVSTEVHDDKSHSESSSLYLPKLSWGLSGDGVKNSWAHSSDPKVRMEHYCCVFSNAKPLPVFFLVTEGYCELEHHSSISKSYDSFFFFFFFYCSRNQSHIATSLGAFSHPMAPPGLRWRRD